MHNIFVCKPCIEFHYKECSKENRYPNKCLHLGKKFKVVGAVTQLGILGCDTRKWNDKEIKKIAVIVFVFGSCRVASIFICKLDVFLFAVTTVYIRTKQNPSLEQK